MSEAMRILGELRGGLVALQFGQKQEELINAIQASGRKGSITLTLNYQPVGSGNREVHVSAKIVAKIPNDPGLEDRSIFYAERGQLHRHDPGQGDLYRGPQGVDTGEAPPRERDDKPINRFGS